MIYLYRRVQCVVKIIIEMEGIIMRKMGVDGVITHLEQWQLKHEELSCYKKTEDFEFGFKIDSNSEVFQEELILMKKVFFMIFGY